MSLTPSEDDRAYLRGFGARVRAARRARGWTQVELGEASGLGATFVSRLEIGKHAATITCLRRIADALGVSPRTLLDGPP